MKRILFLLGGGDWDGPANAARQLAATLTRRGIRVAAWFHSPGSAVDDFGAVGAETAIWPRYGRPFLGRGAVAAGRVWAPDLVHAQSADLAGRATRLARALAVPAWVTVHRLDDPANPRLANYPGLRVIAASDAIRERLANACRVPPARLKVVVDSLDLRQYPRPGFVTPWEENPSARAFVVGAWGRLAAGKGQKTLIQAAARLAADGLDVEILLMGEGPDRPALRRLARELGVESRLTFSPATNAGRLSDLDVLVEPSYREGFGLSALQAMATGVPVVASGVGGLFALVKDGETGLMVPPGDPEALASAVARLLRNPALRRELARRARDRVETDFNADIVAERLLAIYAAENGELLA